MTFRTRFAPSPTGPLHLGHAYSALLAYQLALDADGAFILRIEDIDRSRARLEWERQIYKDLTWLGVAWEEPVYRQSESMPRFEAALLNLWSRGLVYPCTCNRRDIQEAARAPQEGSPIFGPDGLVYPGTCRPKNPVMPKGTLPRATSLRLNMSKAIEQIDLRGLCFENTDESGCKTVRVDADDLSENVGDVVLSRKDMGTSYHLSVVLDDDAQNITHVIRGADLFEATKIHVVLQRLLNLPTPSYFHHKLIRDEKGKRLAKRDDARAISKFRDDGVTPDGIRKMLELD